jgi:hypothetical protein
MYLKKYNNDKVTLCANKNCITVYGDTAKTINTIVACSALIIAVAYIAKILK